MESIDSKRKRLVVILTHTIGWGIVLGFPILFMNKGQGPSNLLDYIRHSSIPLSFCFIFYVNYLFIIPRCIFKQKLRAFLVINVLLVSLMSLGVHLWQTSLFPPTLMSMNGKSPHDNFDAPPYIVLIFRDMLSMIFTVGLAVAVKMIVRWGQIEDQRRETEKNKVEAELKNLRSQMNPHFLLNTLNNIYALIAFDSDKAQQAVQELSRLLRHVLYDNQHQTVSLGKEMDFIKSYIELMRIRLSDNVTVKTEFNISNDSKTPIAPLIFISLIENAFKHGISPTEPSLIFVGFSESEHQVECNIINSNYPKSNKDKSGSGIGLEQVRKRLELLYPNKYYWNYNVSEDKSLYTSQLVIEI